jgi:hypothetical protein
MKTLLLMFLTNLVWQSDAQMHSYFESCFLRASGFGYERMIAPPMVVDDFMWMKRDSGGYKLGTLELIGIAKHESPVVFVDILHRVPEASRETRALTAFEAKAVDSLRGGGDIVVDEGPKRRLVVGALRADATCLKCHQGIKEGDLLGALSYRLDRAILPR